MSYPSIFPTGTTIYKPEKCFNGFTVFPDNGLGIVLIDMNGREGNGGCYFCHHIFLHLL